MKVSKIAVILVLAFLAQSLFLLLVDHQPYWDSAVYLGQGKYIFSLGNAGSWEALRPLVWPILLGLFWKLSPIFFGHLFNLVFSLGSIFLVYRIGKKAYNEKTGFLAAVIMGATPLYFIHVHFLLTEIVAIFFSLLALERYISRRYFAAGLFAGISFMTKFTGGALLVVFFLKKIRKKYLLLLGAGTGLIVMPYLVTNYFLYNNSFLDIYSVFLPFHRYFLAVTAGTPWLFDSSRLFYVTAILKHSAILFLCIFALFFFLRGKEYKILNKLLVYLLAFGYLVFFFLLSCHNLERYILIFLPYLSIVAARGTVLVCRKKVVAVAVGILFLFSIASGYIAAKKYIYPEDKGLKKAYSFFAGRSEKSILTSDPLVNYYTDKKYIPAYTIDRFIYSYEKEEFDAVIYIPDNLVAQDAVYSTGSWEELRRDASLKKELMFARLNEDMNLTFTATYYGKNVFIFTK